MRELESRERVPFRQREVLETHSLSEWEASVSWRNEVYAVALVKAMDEGKSPDEARLVARQAFLDSFSDRPETEFAVSLGGIEVAPMPRRGRRAA